MGFSIYLLVFVLYPAFAFTKDHIEVGPSYEELPAKAVFPGRWEEYIRAPSNKSYIVPVSIWGRDGNLTNADALLRDHPRGSETTLNPGATITYEFAENIAGRYMLL